MAALLEFRPTLLIDLGDLLFPALADLISKRMSEFNTYSLEIETNLCKVLALVTASERASKDPLTVAARRRVVQQGFVEHFLKRAVEINYKVQNDDQEVLNYTHTDNASRLSPTCDLEVTNTQNITEMEI